MTTNISLTIVTSKKPSLLSKQYSLNSTGNLSKPISAGQIVEGEVQRANIDSAQNFADLLVTLQHNQALIYGVTTLKQAKLMSKKAFEAADKPDHALTRTKDFFTWPSGPGVLMLDYDPQNGRPALSRAHLIETITNILPELSKSAYVWWCSSSSLLYNDQEQLQGIRGQRLYILVQDARDIERAGNVLFKRLWLAGLGFYAISRAGSALKRSLIDSCVWQPNRLDFASGAQCTPPLVQRRGEPLPHEGMLLDTVAALPNLIPEQLADYQAAKASALELVKNDLIAIRDNYIQSESKKLAGVDPKTQTLEDAQATITRAVNGGVLSGDFCITLSNGQKVSVEKILENPSVYHSLLTLDPLEPEYDDYKIVGKLFLTGSRPTLHSFAHGGATYRLIRQAQRIKHIKGTTSHTTDETLNLLRNLPDIFDLGDSIAIVNTGTVHLLDHNSLAYWLGSIAQFYRSQKDHNGKTQERSIDPPSQTIRQVLSLRKLRNLKPLKTVITAPVILPSNGRILSCLGYDAQNELFLDMPDTPPPIATLHSTSDLRLTYESLMQPFKDFPVASPLDRGALLASILTAIQRPALNTAPAIGIDAPVQGSGKTFLALCLAALASGKTCSITPPLDPGQDQEARKRLFSLIASGELILIWDNILNDFDSPALAAMLTSEKFSDRILGKTEISEYPNKLLVFLTGNNLLLTKDMSRRAIVCRLDSKLENPATRKFEKDPLTFILKNRQKLVQSGLSLILAYLKSDEFESGGAVPNESTASFEEWDKTVRQVVAWLALHRDFTELADPSESIKSAVAHDPERELLAQTLEAVHNQFGENWFEARELVSLLGSPEKLGGKSELKELIREFAPNSNLTARSIGRILTQRTGKIAGGFCLQTRKSRSRTFFHITK
ncbi:MAG: hypothetical protein RBR82_12130 [Pseudomonas sp.]|nr:hypothetical protein [Pseudomonas sp.]